MLVTSLYLFHKRYTWCNWPPRPHSQRDVSKQPRRQRHLPRAKFSGDTGKTRCPSHPAAFLHFSPPKPFLFNQAPSWAIPHRAFRMFAWIPRHPADRDRSSDGAASLGALRGPGGGLGEDPWLHAAGPPGVGPQPSEPSRGVGCESSRVGASDGSSASGERWTDGRMDGRRVELELGSSGTWRSI